MSEEKAPAEKVEEVATEAKPRATRKNTENLLKSDIANERFAGFTRRASEVLKGHLKKGKEEEEAKKIDGKMRRATSDVVKAILQAKENCHEPYKETLKQVYGDVMENRWTEELENFFTKLVEDFKPVSTKVWLPESKDLGLF